MAVGSFFALSSPVWNTPFEDHSQGQAESVDVRERRGFEVSSEVDMTERIGRF